MTAQGPSDRSVYSTTRLTHEGKEVPVGTDMRQLGLDQKQLKTLLELGEADYNKRRQRSE